MYGMVWYGMVWYGMVWYGMVWYGMVWYGMVWYGMVWYARIIATLVEIHGVRCASPRVREDVKVIVNIPRDRVSVVHSA